MIVKNEERFLEQCLASVAHLVDEINIVDTGSTDRTVEIAQRFGARIEHRPWRDDFGWARNEALAMATKRWILQLDADEELLPESEPAIHALKNTPAHLKGLFIRCSNRSNQYRGAGGGVSHLTVRIFPNHARIRYYGAIHEFPSVDGADITLPALPSPVAILHHGYLDDVMEARSKFARNLSIIEASVQRHPGDSFHWYNLGVTAFLAGQYERAVEALLKMRGLARESAMRAFVPNGLTVLADTLTDHLQRPEEGLGYAREALEIAGTYGNAHFAAGRALEDLKRYEEAREMFRAAIADGAHLSKHYVSDEDVPVWKAQNCIAGTYLVQGDDANALPWLEEALRNSPGTHPVRHNIAGAYERLGRLDDAERVLKALRDDFDDALSCANYANFLLRRGKDREAIAAIDADAPRVGGETAAAMYATAAAVIQRNGWGDGETYLLQAHELAPDSPQTAALLGAMYCSRSQNAIAQGDFAGALAQAEAGLKIAPGDGGLRYNAAIACVNLQRKDDALVHLSLVDAQNAHVYERAEYMRAVLLRELGDYTAALHALDRMQETCGVQLDAVLLRAAILESSGSAGEAERLFQSALPLNPKRAAVELASFYLRAGRIAEAQQVAQQALA